MGIYGAPIKEVSINTYRYLCFAKSVGKNKPVKLNLLSSTDSAVEEHLFRVYYQVQKWLGNELNHEDWGWILKKKIYWSQKEHRNFLLQIVF